MDFPQPQEISMESGNAARTLNDKLSAPLAKIIDKHQDKISAMLASSHTSILGQAVAKDENVRRVASYCYPLLPFLLKMVVKEPVFVGFVMNNREKLLSRLATPVAAGGTDLLAKAS
jgi:hypothetical protein